MIPFNKPYLTGEENYYIAMAHNTGQLAGDGRFTHLCNTWLEKRTSAYKALLTHSCTAALEMAAILSEIRPGDEVILPSYTFVSTANAFVLRGAVPVFCDIREDTLNIDESKIEEAITEKTKAVVVVHYAGVPCEMDSIRAVCDKYSLLLIEDAAQAIYSSYKGRKVGTIGDLGCFSFHETKNISCGEGGALVLKGKQFAGRAEIIREKGTNRTQFFKGQVDKYTWVDIGSSYLPGELVAAVLWAQMQKADEIIEERLSIWQEYYDAFEGLETMQWCRRPIVPENCTHNGHMFYLLMRSSGERGLFINEMKKRGIACVFHYVPLHSSAYGSEIGRCSGQLRVTEDVSDRLVRLPIWCGLDPEIVIRAATESMSLVCSEK